MSPGATRAFQRAISVASIVAVSAKGRRWMLIVRWSPKCVSAVKKTAIAGQRLDREGDAAGARASDQWLAAVRVS